VDHRLKSEYPLSVLHDRQKGAMSRRVASPAGNYYKFVYEDDDDDDDEYPIITPFYEDPEPETYDCRNS